ncbi:MAG: SGNH/GDSL hydrolase family protein [Leptolyngbya sp. RL_3_1]|nr:SGNH/GDSL hydrolase family protein [Leptolyngbya sp. RL_3_1]
MTRRCAWRALVIGISLWLALGIVSLAYSPSQSSTLPTLPTLPTLAQVDPSPPIIDLTLKRALQTGELADSLAATAETAQQWDQVVETWGAAMQQLQAVPPDNPQRVFAQRQGRDYLAKLAIAQRQSEFASRPTVFPSVGSPVLDEQLGVYLSYVATFGPPDVLILGSSRALQGLDPQVLETALSRQDLPTVRVYNLGVNGATAQVINFLLQQVLSPEQLPKLLLWAGGSRAFNSGRVDRTFAAMLASPGYQALRQGQRPALEPNAPPNANPIPISAINGYGFLSVADRFDPQTYYRSYPRVSGQYDGAYQPFELRGVQTSALRAIARFAQASNLPLVFVNLPLSNDYLDDTRLRYERQFQQYLRQEAQAGNFTIVDWLEQWRGQNQFFADPSHPNQAGAVQLAQRLAQTAVIAWPGQDP